MIQKIGLVPAETKDLPLIWEIIQGAIAKRKREGSKQWQDGYPNVVTIENDIENGYAHLLYVEGTPVVYGALICNDEPAYKALNGKWLSTRDFMVLHRLAVAADAAGKGFAKQFLLQMEAFAIRQHIFSIKVDTNFDNLPMLHLLDTLGYHYCGEVCQRGGKRRAYEKLLQDNYTL